ncbi:MAG TPA: hypothetical protein VNL36_06360 [Bacteroidota bacterium]|nr:hypothetical protein [Bacteroidota bacterium]
MTKKIVAFVVLSLMIVGCVRSFNPLFTAKDLIFDQTLIGTWTDNNNNTWTFLKGKEKSYELIYTEKNSPAKFKAHLVKLGKYRFLDLVPEEPGIDNSFFAAHLIPVHTFSRIWIAEDSLRLSVFDNGWLKKMIDSKKISIAHQRQGDGIILTASTRELQKLVVTYADDPKAFPEPGVLRRRK